MKASVPKRVSGKWKHLFICPDRTLFQGLTALLSEVTPGSPFIDLKEYPTTRRAVSEVVKNQSPNICFLDVGSDRDSALGVISDLYGVNPAMPVVAIHTSNDPDLILRCLRQGAREFLFQPFATEQVTAALERLARVLHEAGIQSREVGKVFCVMPGKGASGASTVACSLAFHLQKANGSKKTLLADLDPTTGTISFLLKLRSNYSFMDAMTHSSQLDEDIWRAIITPHQGIDVMISPENPADGAVGDHDAHQVIDYSRGLYGAVVVDARGPYGDWNIALASGCDELLLVTTNELPTLHATQKALAYLDQRGIERSKIRLIVNRYNPDAGLGKEAIETALHLEVFEVLPSDYEAVQRSLMEGRPISPSSSLGRGIAILGDRLMGKQGPAKNKSVLSGIFSLFDTFR